MKKKLLKWIILGIITFLVMIDVGVTVLLGWIPGVGDFIKLVTEVIIELVTLMLTSYIILTSKR